MTAELSWVPRYAVFVRRTLILGAVTFFSLLSLGGVISIYFDVALFWTLPTALLFTVGFVFDDAIRWRTRRYDRWEISNGHLIHEGPDGGATIPLTEIQEVKAGIGSRIIINLTSGKRIEMRYLPAPIQTAQQIEAARRA